MQLSLNITDDAMFGLTQPNYQVTLNFENTHISVRELIETRIRQEIENYNSTQPEVFNMLVQPALAERVLNGFKFKEKKKIDWREQYKKAVEAFERNGFIILVDDLQVESLDQFIELETKTRLLFSNLCRWSEVNFMIIKGIKALKSVLTHLSDNSKKYRSEMSEKLIFLIIEEKENQYGFSFKDLENGKDILDLNNEELIKISLDLIDWLNDFEKKLREKQKNNNYHHDPKGWKVRNALSEIINKQLPFSENEIIKLLNWSVQYDSNYCRLIPQIIRQLQGFFKNNQLSVELEKKIREFIDVVAGSYNQDNQTRKQIAKLKEFVGDNLRLPIVSGETWSDFAISEIENLNSDNKGIWLELLNICQTANGSAPTAKWKKSVEPLLEKIGVENFKSFVLRWFPLVDKPRTQQIATWSEWQPNPNLMINDVNADILKGLVWICGFGEEKEIARSLMSLAISAYKKVPMIGPRCVRVGNACVWALGQMGMEGVGQLAILKLKIKFGTAQKGIEKALNETAKKVGMSAEELEEISVPNYGLTEVGILRESFGDFSAELIVTGTNSAELCWFNSEGKKQKSVPSFVKENHAEDLKELNNAVKDIKKMLPAQRDRIENFYLEEKNWNYKTWRERYLEHTLVATITRRLIWRFDETTTAIWLDGKLVDVNENEVILFDESSVELWHPLHSNTQEVLDWREFLEKHEIRQPFKQAHREIYVLTDAELRTNVYSNRYAAHIIKQHQFNSLCAIKGWKNRLHLMVDDSYEPPTRWLPKQNLRAEFWIEAVGDDYGTDTTESGTYLYLATDQVRFYQTDAQRHYVHAGGGGYSVGWNQTQNVEPLLLNQIPPLVFSEIMRDVDMFVGVCSIGNDPNWQDGGREIHQNYWQSYSFGDLSVSAKSRKEILEKLIPRLKIANKCSFDDKFLIVKGEIRTYKIHLGSGNILMSPNDQYLCIVASGSSENFGQGKVFLPFEGDRTLSIILSKAFMLAEDKKITDQTITRQIK
jgi:hypothetical protein